MFHFNYKDSPPFSISLCDELRELAFILYKIDNNLLHIQNIERNPIANRTYNSDYHFGTMIFNELLLHLNKKEYTIDRITGTLSIADASFIFEREN